MHIETWNGIVLAGLILAVFAILVINESPHGQFSEDCKVAGYQFYDDKNVTYGTGEDDYIRCCNKDLLSGVMDCGSLKWNGSRYVK